MKQKISKAESIYLAGLFDGEGNVGIAVNKYKHGINPKYWLRITIVNTNKKILLYLKKIFKGQLYNNKKSKKYYHKLCWFWSLSSNQAQEFLEYIYYYLRIKKKVVKLAINFQKNMKRYNGYTIEKRELKRRKYYRKKIMELNR